MTVIGLKPQVISSGYRTGSKKPAFAGLMPSNLIAEETAKENGRTPFPDLGDYAERDYPDQVAQEKEEAGLEQLPYFIDIRRIWSSWVISIKNGKALPEKETIEFNRKYGKEVRAFGYMDGMDEAGLKRQIEATLYQNKAVKENGFTAEEKKRFDTWGLQPELKAFYWYADTKEGLRAFVELLKKHFGARTF